MISIVIIPVYMYNEAMNEVMLTTKEAGLKLGLSSDHVRRLLENGIIEGQKIGRDWIVTSLDYKRKRKPKVKRDKS